MACNITIDRREEQFALEREYARMKLLNRECVDKLLDHYSEVLKHPRPAQTWDNLPMPKLAEANRAYKQHVFRKAR